jgi:uncharacterized protein
VMRLPVTLGPSAIHGMGVFALIDIPKGSVVWGFSRIFDHLIPEYKWVRAGADEKAKLFERGYRNPEYPADIYMCGDEGQFLNFPPRGTEPNLELGPFVGEQPSLIAACDIKAGEELTVPPESDADYERKMKDYHEVTLGGVRDGEDV